LSLDNIYSLGVLFKKANGRKFKNNMNEIQIVYDWLIDHFSTNELVNTVSIVPTIELDQNKENIYPLVNIDFINKETEEQAIITTFKITVIQSEIRNYQNKQQVTK
jgi:hypothetical protein